MPPSIHLPFDVCGLSINDKAAWRLNRNYVCRLCGNRAYHHPRELQIWACLTCRLVSDKPNGLFAESPAANDNRVST